MMWRASKYLNRLESGAESIIVVDDTNFSLVGFILWYVWKCLYMFPSWRWHDIRFESLVVVIPMYEWEHPTSGHVKW